MAEQATPIQIRVTPALLAALDAFRESFPFAPSRPEVVHRALVDWLNRQAPPVSTEGALSFDEAKYFLGGLCHNGHDWQHTGQSLRGKSSRHCVQCEKARKKKPATR